MRQVVASVLVIGWFASSGVMAQTRGATGKPPIGACSLLPKELVEKYYPNKAAFPYLKPSEEAIGAKGSGCSYGTIHLQIDPFARPDELRKSPAKDWQPVSGVGDTAFFHNNKDRFAELMVWTGSHHFTIQMSVNMGRTAENTKPDTIAVANAIIPKLR